ncbi:T9SS type A sorting domain-containing protein [Hymenobacter aquaticus]|uniref:T9SS type A sorting domain-containing protein n=1 Tax=Hymenobacter aquaticus TaxID=1867101 RepID=A0A4Z0PWZ2_9BACT|nr:Ig-like domain-containing protein [Hymenobacter aquaticus]TGE22227.1 T9SS type A sorting domain-containing protein [Hymenobacter aquaticus]
MTQFSSGSIPKLGRLLLLLLGLLATLTAAATAPAAAVTVSVTQPTNNSVVTTIRPVYAGTTGPNTAVTVWVDGGVTRISVTSDASGNWQVRQPTNLSNQFHTVHAVVGTLNSNVVNFTVTPAAPTLTSTTPGGGPEGDTFALTGANLYGVTSIKFDKNPSNPGNVTATSGFTISDDGTQITGIVIPFGARSGLMTVTAPGGISNGIFFDAYLRITVNRLVRQTPTAASTNANSVAFRMILTNSPQPALSASNFTLVASAGITGASITSAAPFSFGSPTYDIVVNTGTGEGTISVQLTSNTPGATRMVSNLPYTAGEVYTIDRTAPTAAAVLSSPLNGAITSGQPAYSGTAEALSRVTVLVDGTSVGTATTTAAGDWTLTQPTPLAAGTHTISTTLQDQAGNDGPAGAASTFVVDLTPTVLTLTPGSAPIGGTISLSGTNLTGVTTITFEKSPNVSTYPTTTSGFVINAAGTQITGIVVPVGAKSGNLTVTSPNGTSSPQFFALVQDLVITGNQTIPPGSYNSITIGSGSTATLSSNVTVTFQLTVADGGTLNTSTYVIGGNGSFTLASGGTLSTANANGIAASGATGAIQTTGTRSFSTDASYSYAGSGAMVTGSGLPSQVRNLTINNFASPVTLSAPVSVAQVVTIGSSGNLVLNGNALTLLSSGAGTAMVVNSGTGIISGNTAVVQRYIDPSLNSGLGYRHYSSPVAAATFADLATGTYTPVVNPDYNTLGNAVTPFPTVFGYNEARLVGTSPITQNFDYGYFSPEALSSNLVRGRGYTGNLDAGSLVDLVGTLNTGSVAVGALTRGTETNSGWHFLGNPYPAPLDWKKVRVNLPTGMIDAVYVYKSTDQYGGTYQVFQNGFGSLPGGIIGSMQGFFVRVSQTVNSFNFISAWRSTTLENPVFNRPAADLRPALQLDLVSSQGTHDPTYVYFEEGATAGLDDHYDAEKLPNTTGLNLASVAVGKGLAVNGLPLMPATLVPLTVGVPVTGSYTLQAASLANFGSTPVYLLDAETGQQVDLTKQSTYRFSASNAALITGRFTLSFGALRPLATNPATLAADVSVYPNPAHEQFSVLIPAVSGATQVEADLLNSLGQVVSHHTAPLPAAGTSLSVSAKGVKAGVYTLRLRAGTTTLTKRVIVQ